MGNSSDVAHARNVDLGFVAGGLVGVGRLAHEPTAPETRTPRMESNDKLLVGAPDSEDPVVVSGAIPADENLAIGLHRHCSDGIDAACASAFFGCILDHLPVSHQACSWSTPPRLQHFRVTVKDQFRSVDKKVPTSYRNQTWAHCLIRAHRFRPPS